MNDPYPPHLTIEIDRKRLAKYLCFKWLLMWVFLCTFFGFISGMGNIVNTLEGRRPPKIASLNDLLLLISSELAMHIGIAFLIAVLLYFIFSHRFALRSAASLEVSVEGPFLHLRQHATLLIDRKLHFRSIVDYATTQDFWMRQFDISSLQMTTTAGGPQSTVTIPGVKDCLKVRDMLSEIDRQRENH